MAKKLSESEQAAKKVAAEKKAQDKAAKAEEARLKREAEAAEKAKQKAKAEAEKPKLSIRETLALRGEKVIKDANKVITDLRELGTFAKNNNRPAKHFDIFAQQLEGFVNRISRMLR